MRLEKVQEALNTKNNMNIQKRTDAEVWISCSGV